MSITPFNVFLILLFRIMNFNNFFNHLQDFDDEEVTFCTEKCYTKFATVYQEINKPPPEDPMRNLTLSKHHSSDFSPRSLGSHTPTTPTKSDSTLTLTPTTPNSGGALTPVQPSPPIKSRLEDKISKKHRRTASIEAPFPKVSVSCSKDLTSEKNFVN